MLENILVTFAAVQNFINFFSRQILMKIKPELKHRSRPAGAQTLNQRNRESSVGRRFARLDPQPRADVLCNLRLAHDLARERLANLDMVFADGLSVDHRIEGRDL